MQLDLFDAHDKSARQLASEDRAIQPLEPLHAVPVPAPLPVPAPAPVPPPPAGPSDPPPTQADMIAEKKRLSAQSKTILEMLQRGRVSNSQLQEIAFNYTARISELRTKGKHNIRCVDRNRKTGLSWYELVPGPQNPPENTPEI